MKKNSKGITLIALIITIIILLILAGISISALTGNGLFENAKLAKQKATEAEVREKIEMMFDEYQMEKVNNEDLNLYEYFSQKKENGEIETLKDNEDGTIKVGLKGYTIIIDEKETTIISIEIANDIEFSYELTSYENNKFKILIKISDKTNGIDTIRYPDGDIQECNGIEELAIDYEVDEGVDYVFIAKNSNNIEKKEVINFIKPKKPIIPDVTIEYPILTLTGFNRPKVQIIYDEREEFLNYYSLDNGETWNLYTGEINADYHVIKVKSVHKKCPDIYEEMQVTLLPMDSIEAYSYDGDIKTGSLNYGRSYYGTPEADFFGDYGIRYARFRMDSSMWGSNINAMIGISGNFAPYIHVVFLNEKKEFISKVYVGQCIPYTTTSFEDIKIPEGAVYGLIGGGCDFSLLEISPVNIVD